MKIVGITGRSGCGKSSVSSTIREKGYQVIDADIVAREIMEPPSRALAALTKRFGADILDEGGNLKRRMLADRAFATPEGTKDLTDITFEEIISRIMAAAEQARQAGERLYFVDAALIVGTPFREKCDKLIVVCTPYETSVARIAARDSISPEMARRRLDAQLPQETINGEADYLLMNDSDLDTLRQRTLDVLTRLENE